MSSIFKPVNVPNAFVQQSPRLLKINGHALYAYAYVESTLLEQERVRIIEVPDK